MEYSLILKNLFDSYIVSKFHKLSALFVTLFIALWLLLSVHAVIRSDFDYEWYLYGFIYVCIFTIWLFYKYGWPYPKNKKDRDTGKGKTGLVIAIFSENYEGVKMKNKFIKELEKQINDSGLHKYFNIIVVPNHYSEKIKNNDDIEKIHEKINGHIYFYGDIQKEKDGKDKTKYFLDINGYVKHLPIPIPVSQELSFDFGAILPKEIVFDDFFELRGCKATAKIIYLTSKYIVGVASFLSGNPFLAFELHKNLSGELNEYEKINNDKKIKDLTKFDFKHIRLIKNKIPLIISGEALIISKIYYFNNNEEEAKKAMMLSLKNNPNNYGSWLLKAIFDFQYDDDPGAAMESIKRAKKFAKNRCEWRYSWAFLKFWFSEYLEAYKMCVKIKEQYYEWESITLDEVENFNLNILKNINKPQLYFWIGYLNYKKKNNLPRSLEYFENFVNNSNADSDDFLIKKAETFLIEIRREMNLAK